MGTIVTWKRKRKLVLYLVEEKKLVEYVNGMANLKHSVDIMGLKLKVAAICQERKTPFHEGIPVKDGCNGYFIFDIQKSFCLCHKDWR